MVKSYRQKELHNFLRLLQKKQNQRKLLSFKFFSDNLERIHSPYKTEDFPANFYGGNSRCLFLLVEMFSLELVPEFSALKFLYILQNFFFNYCFL